MNFDLFDWGINQTEMENCITDYAAAYWGQHFIVVFIYLFIDTWVNRKISDLFFIIKCEDTSNISLINHIDRYAINVFQK